MTRYRFLTLAAQALTSTNVRIIGPNTASYIQMGDQVGSLEAGKVLDTRAK